MQNKFFQLFLIKMTRRASISFPCSLHNCYEMNCSIFAQPLLYISRSIEMGKKCENMWKRKSEIKERIFFCANILFFLLIIYDSYWY